MTALAARLPGYLTVNPLSTVLSFALPATLGSGISVCYHASAAWCILEVSLRAGFSRDRVMWAAAACLSAYAGISFLAFWINGLGDDYGALIPLLTLVTLPFAYSVLAIARKADLALAAVIGSMAASYVAAAAALGQFLIEGERAEGLAGNPLVFGHVSSLAGSVCLIGLMLGFTRFRGRPFRRWLIGGFVAACAAVLLSGSRTYWIVFAVQTLLVLGFGSFRPGAVLTTKRVVIGTLITVSLVAVAYVPVSKRLHAFLRDWGRLGRENYDTSLGLRFRLMELGLRLIREHPWIGYGVPSNRPLVMKGLAEQFHLDRSFSHFHNGFVTAAVETGLIGLAALVCLLAIMAYAAAVGLRGEAEPARRFGGLMMAVLLAGTVIGGLPNIVIGHDIIDATLMVWLSVGLFLACGRPRPEPGPASADAA